MKLFNFIAIGFGLCRGNTGADVNIASLAENLDKIKFELHEILASREAERDHLEVISDYLTMQLLFLKLI